MASDAIGVVVVVLNSVVVGLAAGGVDWPHAVTMATRRAAVENLAAVMDRRLRIPLRNQALKSGSSS